MSLRSRNFRKKLIEVALPLEVINVASAREKLGWPYKLLGESIIDCIFFFRF